MKLLRTPHFERNYAKAPSKSNVPSTRSRCLRSPNSHHPSLRAKKYDEGQGLWQARVNKDWRFYFLIQNDGYLIVNIIPHPK